MEDRHLPIDKLLLPQAASLFRKEPHSGFVVCLRSIKCLLTSFGNMRFSGPNVANGSKLARLCLPLAC